MTIVIIVLLSASEFLPLFSTSSSIVFLLLLFSIRLLLNILHDQSSASSVATTVSIISRCHHIQQSLFLDTSHFQVLYANKQYTFLYVAILIWHLHIATSRTTSSVALPTRTICTEMTVIVIQRRPQARAYFKENVSLHIFTENV